MSESITLREEDGKCPHVATATRGFTDGCEEIIVDRRLGNPPRNDLAGTVVNVSFGDRKINREEAISDGNLLILDGLETTSSTLVSSIKHNAEHPKDQVQLRANPELTSDATEELLRLYGSAIQLTRVAQKDAAIAGFPIAKVERVALGFGGANRDSRKPENPDEYVIDLPANRHAAFGIGLHRCLGSHLVRTMLQIGLRTFVERISSFEIAPGATPRQAVAGVCSLESLEVTFVPKGRE